MNDKMFDIDRSVIWLLEVAAHLHSCSELGIEDFLDDCKWIYEKEIKQREIKNENN